MSEDGAATPLLDVEDLQIEIITATGVVRAVDGVSFRVDRGETVTIIGESGSGKSTTAMGVLRLLPDDTVVSGRVRLSGVDVVADASAAARLRGHAVALVPQDPMTALSPVHTVERQMGDAIKVAGGTSNRAERRARALELLEAVRIPNPAEKLRCYPHQFSGGQLQRVLIAIALAGDPRLLVADEPTSALDVTVQAGILDLLMELQERTGVGILMITHDLGVARLVSDRIHVMSGGRFVESGAAAQVVDEPREEYTRNLLAAVPRLGEFDDRGTAGERAGRVAGGGSGVDAGGAARGGSAESTENTERAGSAR
ncbi:MULTISPECIES: ABC transporter ATP-binding protein [Actinosynnema]|uniref:ABC transporter ATP-binding protein n=1 Tax=Actinosynnema TaxID=40566 RepID=UPI0020A2674A|nr:ABC transporter ATP-binding protein [Actinosynnema pretiosum]MCP2092499.1 ABC-type dipeptide/oligopeptide/nickel transport system, ATPase component [Actinosynnema pretiosum]